jgi:dTDP-3-amino-2,3,6-trideoxy-4-keto-D-glucose/dTDP-3-amino-3,4,6-trideoxy-alpha-D-glucose/dTDP-2,6-dideoxy-D-kanosamine transaminase
MTVPLNDLSRLTATMLPEVQQAIQRVLAGGSFIMGPEVEAFELEFAAYLGTAECAGVASGSDALEIALRALDLRAGSHVATVANAGSYSTVAIRAVGATPIYVDVSRESLTMCPDSLAVAMTHRVDAIVATHLYGRMACMDRIMQCAEVRGIPVIEDCAQAHGAALDGRKAGTWGTVGCFSFYPSKNLGALGDGGAVVSDDSDLIRKAKRLRTYGWDSKYVVATQGGRNSRLDELQAAILRVKLPRLDEWNRMRRAIANEYTRAIRNSAVETPPSAGFENAAHLYVVRTPSRAALMKWLREHGIGCDIHFPIPDHQQPAWELGKPARLPTTEAACREVISVPCFPGMSEAEVRAVVAALNDWMPGAPA